MKTLNIFVRKFFDKKLINRKWYISFKHIILLLLFVYILWLVKVFYSSIVEIDQMYSDSYDKRVDEKQKISEIIDLKRSQESDYYDYKLWIDEILWK